ncbi:MAG: pyrroline-5-carboxylate reductase [Acetobacteraceae bacterium]|nr:pyrroline-5-carboxylate reductase [Acetobacteraceae bacterium]
MDAAFRLAILGGGNIGLAIARGLAASGRLEPDRITITRRKAHLLEPLMRQGFRVQSGNRDAVKGAEVVVIAVGPQHMLGLLREIGPDLVPGRHVVISVVTGVSVGEIKRHIPPGVAVVRAMPNLAIAIRESMTCLAADAASGEALELAKSLFEAVGTTLVIDEELMVPATALCACGVAFFLRAIRAASQGGIEIGFHSGDALAMAAQTARGAASLLLSLGNHPEMEIDRVTTPRGCTIAGLNRMEDHGFSSAMIKGITTSAEKAAELYRGGEAAAE